MCSLITVLVLVGLICSIICKDKKEALIRSGLITFWLTNLIVNLINNNATFDDYIKSIDDTVIIYDRIRENTMANRKMSIT